LLGVHSTIGLSLNPIYQSFRSSFLTPLLYVAALLAC
jgi:hypothetical protein